MEPATRKTIRTRAMTLGLLLMMVGPMVIAQNSGSLTVKGTIVCDKADRAVKSSVTVYRYYHQSKSVELMEQVIIQRDGNFKFRLEFDKDYIIDVASNTGVHKRVNLNTEVMKGYKYQDQVYQFAVNVMADEEERPDNVVWIFFDPSKNDFDLSDHMPVAFE